LKAIQNRKSATGDGTAPIDGFKWFKPESGNIAHKKFLETDLILEAKPIGRTNNG
jgi:hypothetical protein